MMRLDDSALNVYKNTFFAANEAWEDSLDVYYALVDTGNTPDMISGINGPHPSSSLYASVAPISPWLSDSAIIAVTNVHDMSYSYFVNLLKMNPNVLKNGDVLANAQTTYSLDDTDMAALTDTAVRANNRRAGLEASIARNKMVMDNAANIVMMALKSPNNTSLRMDDTTGAAICTDSNSMYYMLDSNMTYAGYDSVDRWLVNIGSVWAWYARVGYYYEQQDNSTALTILNTIGGAVYDTVNFPGEDYAFAYTDDDTTVFQTYLNLWNALYRQKIYKLSDDAIAMLDTTSTPEYTYNTARQIIYNITVGIITGSVAAPFCHYPALERSGHFSNNSGSEQQGDNIGLQGRKDRFTAFPNPAKGFVTFAYNAPDAGDDIRIVITNVMGEKVAELHTGNNTGRIVWDTRQQQNGVYVYQATSSGRMISNGKIVVVR